MKVLIIFLLFLYIYTSIEVKEIFLSLSKINIYVLLIALIMGIPNLLLQFLKWKIICNNSLSEYNNRNIFDSLFSGFSAAIITPARIGEFAGRMLGLYEKSPLKVASATLFDKLFTFIQIILIGIISTTLYLYYFWHLPVELLSSVILGVSLIILLIFFFRKRFNEKIIFIKKKVTPSKILPALEILTGYKKRTIFKLFILSLSFYICYLIQFVFLIFAFSNQPDLHLYFWFGSLIMLAKALLPFSIGEIGIRESASIFFLSQIGVESSAAFNASFFLFLINILLPSLIGLVIFFRKNND